MTLSNTNLIAARHILKDKKAQFRLTYAAQKLRCLNALGPVQTPNFSQAEPNTLSQVHKISASESIRNACFNLDRLSRSFRLAWLGFLDTLAQYLKSFCAKFVRLALFMLTFQT